LKIDTYSENLSCPECARNNIVSKLYIQAEHVRAKPNVFWDESGKKHFHIVDVCLETLRCSKHHTFMQVSAAKCHCGWTSLEFLKMLIAIGEGQIVPKE
jgi:hypothetical protein